MRVLLLWGAIASIALSALPAKADVTEPQVGALVEALRRAAPQTGKENDGLYSDWQIKPANIPRWSKRCIGRSLTTAEFEADTATARRVLACVMGGVYRDQYRASGNNESVAVRRSASWWMTGDPTRYQEKPTAAYTQKVLGFYQQQRGSNTSATDTSTQPKPQTRRSPKPPAGRAAQPAQVVEATARGTQVTEAELGALVEALRLAAPKTGKANDGLYSEWQIKPENITRWSKQCTGRELTPAEFEANPVTARKIVACVMGDVLRQQYRASDNNESKAVERSASWWMTGEPALYEQSQTAGYTQKVLGYYQELRSDKVDRVTLFPDR